MANTPVIAKANTGTGTDAFASDLISGTNYPITKVAFGAEGTATTVDGTNRLPVDIGTVSVSVGNFPATQTVSGSVSVANFPASQAVTGPLTDTQLRATAVPISGTVNTGLTQPLTDTQLRATAVPVSGNVGITGSVAVTGTFWQATQPVSGTVTANAGAGTFTVGGTVTANAGTGTFAVSGPLTDAQLRATAIPVSLPNMVGLSYNVAGVIVINTDLLVIDCQGYEGISIQCVSMGTSGVVTPAWSNNNVDYQAATILTQAGVTATTFNAAGIWTTPVLGRYLRLRLTTATTAGTTTLSVQGMTQASNFPVAAQPVSGTVTVTGTVTANQGTILTPTASFVTSAATTNGTVLKAAAGTVYGVVASNTNAAARFLKFHNSTTITVGTTAVALTVPIPANSVVSLNFGQLGMRFGTGICLSITGAAGDTDTTAIAANEVKVLTSYI